MKGHGGLVVISISLYAEDDSAELIELDCSNKYLDVYVK